MRGGTAVIRVLGVLVALAATGPGLALAADSQRDAPDAGLDLGLEQRSSKSPLDAWDWAVDGSAVLPVVSIASQYRLGLRLTDTGRVDHLAAHLVFRPTDLTEAQALFWNGRMDRGPNNQVAITLAGGIHLDALADRFGLPRTTWVEVGIQTRNVPTDATGHSRMSSTLVLSLDFDASAQSVDGRSVKGSSGLRIRASAALGNDPGCSLGTPTLLFSGRCLTLALAVDF